MKHPNTTDEVRMVDNEGTVSQSMDMDVGGCNVDIQNSKECMNVNNTESAGGKECASNLKISEGKGRLLKVSSYDSITRKVPADLLKARNVVEEKQSGKVLNLSEIRDKIISAQERIRENTKKLLMCEETSMLYSQEVENNCMSPLTSSVLEKRNSEALDNVLNIEGSVLHHQCPCLEFEMRAVIDYRLKVIAKKLSLPKKDNVVAAQKTKDSNPCGNNSKGVGEDEIRKGEESENLLSKPSTELENSHKMSTSLSDSLKNHQINALEVNSSLSDANKQSLDKPECMVGFADRSASVKKKPTSAALPPKTSNSEPCMSEVEIKNGDNSKNIASKPTGNFKSSEKENKSIASCKTFPQNIPSMPNSSSCYVDKERIKQESEESSCISLNVRAKDQVPVIMSKVQSKEDHPSSKLLPKLEVNASPKRFFGQREGRIQPLRRVKVESCEKMESRLLQSKELNCENLCSALSPSRMLRVNLGYRCDSSEFQQLRTIESRNCSIMSMDIHSLKWIKAENVDKENCSIGEVVVKQEKVTEEETSEESTSRKQVVRPPGGAEDVQCPEHQKKKRKL